VIVQNIRGTLHSTPQCRSLLSSTVQTTAAAAVVYWTGGVCETAVRPRKHALGSACGRSVSCRSLGVEFTIHEWIQMTSFADNFLWSYAVDAILWGNWIIRLYTQSQFSESYKDTSRCQPIDLNLSIHRCWSTSGSPLLITFRLGYNKLSLQHGYTTDRAELSDLMYPVLHWLIGTESDVSCTQWPHTYVVVWLLPFYTVRCRSFIRKQECLIGHG